MPRRRLKKKTHQVNGLLNFLQVNTRKVLNNKIQIS